LPSCIARYAANWYRNLGKEALFSKLALPDNHHPHQLGGQCEPSHTLRGGKSEHEPLLSIFLRKDGHVEYFPGGILLIEEAKPIGKIAYGSESRRR
jgi:hypothetical protein